MKRSTSISISLIGFLVAVVFIGIGFYTMFHYGDYNPDYPSIGDKTGHIVGGDAYNYIIIGIRGLGFMLTGLVFSVIGAVFAVVTVSLPQEHEGNIETPAVLGSAGTEVNGVTE